MNFRQLETFYWATKLGSFNAAAQKLNATQSTVSMRITELERDLGIELFDRSQRTARPIGKARELMYYAEQMLQLSQEMHQRISSADSVHGLLRMGVAEMVSLTWLPKLVKLVHERYPKIMLELDEALTNDLVERLNNGALDLILAPGRVPGYNITPVSLGIVEHAWMASPELGLPDRVLVPKDFQDVPVIALSPQSYHHKAVEDWFASGNAHCRRIDTCKSFGVAASLCAAGLGVTLLPPRFYQHEIDAGRLKIIPTDPVFPRVEFMATCAVENVEPAARTVALMAREVSTFELEPE